MYYTTLTPLFEGIEIDESKKDELLKKFNLIISFCKEFPGFARKIFESSDCSGNILFKEKIFFTKEFFDFSREVLEKRLVNKDGITDLMHLREYVSIFNIIKSYTYEKINFSEEVALNFINFLTEHGAKISFKVDDNSYYNPLKIDPLNPKNFFKIFNFGTESITKITLQLKEKLKKAILENNEDEKNLFYQYDIEEASKEILETGSLEDIEKINGEDNKERENLYKLLKNSKFPKEKKEAIIKENFLLKDSPAFIKFIFDIGDASLLDLFIKCRIDNNNRIKNKERTITELIQKVFCSSYSILCLTENSRREFIKEYSTLIKNNFSYLIELVENKFDYPPVINIFKLFKEAFFASEVDEKELLVEGSKVSKYFSLEKNRNTFINIISNNINLNNAFSKLFDENKMTNEIVSNIFKNVSDPFITFSDKILLLCSKFPVAREKIKASLLNNLIEFSSGQNFKTFDDFVEMGLRSNRINFLFMLNEEEFNEFGFNIEKFSIPNCLRELENESNFVYFDIGYFFPEIFYCWKLFIPAKCEFKLEEIPQHIKDLIWRSLFSKIIEKSSYYSELFQELIMRNERNRKIKIGRGSLTSERLRSLLPEAERKNYFVQISLENIIDSFYSLNLIPSLEEFFPEKVNEISEIKEQYESLKILIQLPV